MALDLDKSVTPAATRAVDDELGTVTLTMKDSFKTSPAYQVEVFTVQAIQGFLIVTSVVLIGAFFLIWTIQRTAEIGLVKALGASNAYLLKDSVGQALLLMVGGIVVGVVLAMLTGVIFKQMVDSGFPFDLQATTALGSALLLLIAGLVGSALSIRLITRVDPIIALGRDR
ncbi:MAG: ABC transporter permease [Gammaproteobacteria bacterium]